MRRLAKAIGGLFLLAVLALAGFHLVENWRGKRAWERWKAQRVAQGDRYDWSTLVPPEVPDGENFAKSPVMEPAIRGNHGILGGFQLPGGPAGVAPWRTGRREDLDAWRKAFGNPDLLMALVPGKGNLDAIVEATQRPKCRLLSAYDLQHLTGESMPMLLGTRAAGKALWLRALARLEAGRTAEALEDVLALLRFSQHFKDEPFLIAHLHQAALVGFAMQPIWEGVVDHRWNEAQLAALQRELEGVDLLRSHRRWVEGERCFMAGSLQAAVEAPAWDRAKGMTLDFENPEAGPSKARTLLVWLTQPKGWIYQNLVVADRTYGQYWLPALDAEDHRLQREAIHQAGDWIVHVGEQRRYRLAAISLPALLGQTTRTAERQNAVDEAIVACALERQRLAIHRLPATLADLQPAYLAKVPQDLLTGASLLYRSQSDGGFRLGSPGWNPKPGNAEPLAPDDRANFRPEEGSWLWQPSRATR